MTDNEIKEKVKKQLNGEYAYKICRHCMNYFISPDSRTDNVKLVDICNSCPDIEERFEKMKSSISKLVSAFGGARPLNKNHHKEIRDAVTEGLSVLKDERGSNR